MFESLRARLNRLLEAHSRPDPRARTAALRDALLEAKVGVSTMRSALGTTERELSQERRHLADAERRGRLAAELPDPETATIAERFVVRHRERVAMLERKLAVQRDELLLAEREMADLLTEYRSASPGTASASIDAAWRDIEAAGGERPGMRTEDDLVRAESDQKLKEAVEAQLAFLKKKLGKDSKHER